MDAFSRADAGGFFVLREIHSKQHDASQRGMIAQNLLPFYRSEAKERQRLSEGQGVKGPVKLPEVKTSDARDAAGKAAGVSGTYVDMESTGTARGWR